MTGALVLRKPRVRRAADVLPQIAPELHIIPLPEQCKLRVHFSGEMTPAKARALATMLTIYADRLEAEVS